MRRSRILVALVGLFLALGADGAARASGSAISEAGAGSTTCPSTSDEQKLAVARAWQEDVINRRSPATLQDILAPEVVHHAAGGYPAVMNRDGVTAMMNDFLRAFPDLQYAFDLLLRLAVAATSNRPCALRMMSRSNQPSTLESRR